MNKALPSNIEAEQALLGAIMVNNQAWHRVSQFMQASHFFEPIHTKIFDVMSQFISAGKVANPVTLKNFLPVDEKITEGMNFGQYMARIAAEAVTVINAEDYGRLVTNLWQRRRMIAIGEDMVNQAWDAPILVDATEIAAQMSEEVSTLISNSQTAEDDNSASAVSDGLMSDTPNLGRAVTWPLMQIKEVAQDDMRTGQYTGILSSSGEGKTSLVLQCVYHFATCGSPVLLISYDQSGPECVMQMATQHLGIEGARIRAKTLQEREFDQYVGFLLGYKSLPIEVHRCTNQGIRDIRTKVMKFTKKYARRFTGPPVIVIDHVKKISLDQDFHEGKAAGVKNMALKAMAIEFDAAVIGLMQRSSEGMKRPNPRPISSDLYGGQGAKEDFDNIIYLYRPEKYKEEQLRIAKDAKESEAVNLRFKGWDGMAEIGALKVRFGNPSQRRRLAFEAEFTRYVSMRDETPSLLDGF